MTNIKKSYSWLTVNDNILVKIADKSFFIEYSTGVPQNLVVDTFGIQIDSNTKAVDFKIMYKFCEYSAKYSRSTGNRIKIVFDKDLIDRINYDLGGLYSRDQLSVPTFKSIAYPVIVFRKINSVFYMNAFSNDVSFLTIYSFLSD